MKKKLLVFLCILLLAGCTAGQTEQTAMQREFTGESPVTIKILTDLEAWNTISGVKRRINRVLKYYHTEHPNVEFEVETLPPRSSGERETFLQSRRVALLAGETPDIYLFPTLFSSQIRRNGGTSVKQNESLFRDVAQAQTNQWFADISSYYDSDTELHTEELQKVVMDAGVVEDARYILPLGYSFELLLADKARWDQEPDLADSTGVTLADLLDTGAPEWIPDWLWWGHLPLNALPQLADYDKETILVDKAQLTVMLEPMTRASQLSRERYFSPARAQSISYLSYIQAKRQCPATPFDGNNWCVHTTLEQVLAGSLPTAKCEGQELQMIPLKTADGQLVADITYWGAVSSSSENVAIAYDVLRLFLTPGVQHGTGLVYSDGTVQEIEPEDPGEDSWSPGWPVRYKGFVKAQWEREQKVLEMTYSDRPERKEALLALELDDSDLPILDEEIHYARFTGALDQELHTLLEPLQWQAASEEEIEQIADTFLRDLKYHLAEG